MIVDAKERTAYTAAHYWDAMDFSDPAWLNDSIALEEAFVDWCGRLSTVPDSVSAQLCGTATKMAENGSRAMLLRFAGLAEYYFDSPNSPCRSEDCYMGVLRVLLASDSLDATEKMRPRMQLDMALRNRPGMSAADFAFRQADGSMRRLYDVEAAWTLLLFYDPDCPDCRRVERYIAGSAVFGRLMRAGRLQVVAVYPDEDLSAWRAQLDEMPAGWIVGHDSAQRINDDDLYVVRATPTLYLLDQKKRVVMKDARVEDIERCLFES